MENLIKKPYSDPRVRSEVDKKRKGRFLSADERRHRIMAAMSAAGIKSINEMSSMMGLPHSQVIRTMKSDRISLQAVERFCIVLNVSMSYLTERSI